MKRLKCSTFLLYMLLIIDAGRALSIISVNKQMRYEYVGSVGVGAKAPQDDEHATPPTSGWIVRGKLTLQMQTPNTMAAALSIDEITLNNSGEKFLQNKEMFPPYKPFKIVFNPDGIISHLVFKESDPVWSTNFKRAIASTLQFQMRNSGAFVVNEAGIHGQCSTEYFISNKTNYISIRKTPELKTCTPFTEAIHVTRSNVPQNLCEFDFQKSVIIGNEIVYGLLPHPDTEYFLSMVHVKGTTLIHTFESTGEAQYINSELFLNFLNESTIDNSIDIETSMATEKSDLKLLSLDLSDPTGGRHPQLQETLIANSSEMLNSLAEGLENPEFKFNQPYDSTVSDVIKLLSQMEYKSLKKLYTEVDIGTSYRQETIRNIFHEIIPRIGTKASVYLTKNLIMEKQIKSTIAVHLLISLPFHIFELSSDLVKECEVFLNLGPDRPDVRQAAILSFATLVHNVFVAGKISKDIFEVYVQKYFNLYLNGHDYEQKMLYLQGLSNLQLGNVANYLDPILRDEDENQDIKFLAAWATMSLAPRRPEKIYEIYWPIFESKNASLELRVAAVTLLLISNPTPARLISIHRIIQSETCPHMINYYRTTITSISETTFPCYQYLRRLLSYMHRHLPQKPESRYWVTGNYIFDYRDSKFGIGAMLQAFLVGDPKSDLPVVAYFKFDTEALGKFTGQLALYIKARGLPDAIVDKFLKNNTHNFKFENLKQVLKQMEAPLIENKPIHLEFILQMEGKTVLSYYLNQKTFLKLTYNEIINRLNFLIRADSHINMQTVRWPFMTTFSVPTVLGTTADVLLQTTVLTSLRGNITQHRKIDGIKTTHQIDARYSSYASCRSRSYNPFLNLDHEINREQGLLIYIPINNDLNANFTTKCIKYSFSRPENLTSGLSFKSRSVTSTKGIITKSANQLFEEIILPERQHDVFQIFKYETDDLGISLAVNTNLKELNKYRGMLLKSEFMENGFSRSMAMKLMMYLFGISQLSSIHLGHDRNFTMLVYNENTTKIEGSICVSEEQSPTENVGQQLAITMAHLNDISNEKLHEWNLRVNLISSIERNWFNLIGKMERKSKFIDRLPNWKACINMTYSSLVFARNPHTLKGLLTFGNITENDDDCPTIASKVEFTANAGPSEIGQNAMLDNDTITDNDFCPNTLLKFSPIPTSKYCKKINFENFTSITKYNMELKFNDMPEWFDVLSTRLDHLVSAISEKKVDRLSLNQQIDFSLETRSDYFWLTIEVNGIKCRIYHIPFLQKAADSIYDDASQEIAYNSGLKRSCSIINGMLNTFDDYFINLSEFTQKNNSCIILLAADCSINPEMAIFLIQSNQSLSNTNYGLRIHIGENYFTLDPDAQYSKDNPIFITLNNIDSAKIDIRNKPYQHPINAKFPEFRAEINEHNILTIENMLMHSTIQFDMKNIFNFEIYGVYKSKMCGLCNMPWNAMKNYTLCA